MILSAARKAFFYWNTSVAALYLLITRRALTAYNSQICVSGLWRSMCARRPRDIAPSFASKWGGGTTYMWVLCECQGVPKNI